MAARSITRGSVTVLPNSSDRRQLMDITEALSGIDARFSAMTAKEDFPVAMLKVPGKQPKPLTPELADALLKVAEQLSRGKAVFIAPYETELTTQDAADLLGVSRPTLIKLLETGAIPFEKVGRHRRVLLADVQRYAADRHREDVRMLDELAADENPADTIDNPLIAQ